MKFVFNGDYTNGRDSITILGHTFVGREPTDVEGEMNIRRLRNHVEFQEVRPRAVEDDKPNVAARKTLKVKTDESESD